MKGCRQMYDRRHFLRSGLLAGAALAAACRTPSRSSIDSAVAHLAKTVPPDDVATDERFWREVRQAHDLETELVNLNHGLSPAPRSVQATLMAQIKRVNEIPVLREHDDEAETRREESRVAAARVLGCDAEEVALVRSGTESLHMAQLGIDLEPGDEVLSTREDYWTTWAAWQQRSAREGIVYREIDLGGPSRGAEGRAPSISDATLGASPSGTPTRSPGYRPGARSLLWHRRVLCRRARVSAPGGSSPRAIRHFRSTAE